MALFVEWCRESRSPHRVAGGGAARSDDRGRVLRVEGAPRSQPLRRLPLGYLDCGTPRGLPRGAAEGRQVRTCHPAWPSGRKHPAARRPRHSRPHGDAACRKALGSPPNRGTHPVGRDGRAVAAVAARVLRGARAAGSPEQVPRVPRKRATGRLAHGLARRAAEGRQFRTRASPRRCGRELARAGNSAVARVEDATGREAAAAGGGCVGAMGRRRRGVGQSGRARDADLRNLRGAPRSLGVPTRTQSAGAGPWRERSVGERHR